MYVPVTAHHLRIRCLFGFLVALALSLVAQVSGATIELKVKNTSKKTASKCYIGVDESPFDGYEMVGSLFSFAPGDEITRYGSFAGGSDSFIRFRLFAVRQDYNEEGNSYVWNEEGGEVEQILASWGPYTDEYDGETISREVSNFVAIPAVTLPDQKTLWKMATTEVDGAVYREGIDKVVAAVNQAAAQSSTGGGGGGGMTKEEFLTTSTEAAADTALNMYNDRPSQSEMVAESESQRAATEAAYSAQAKPTSLGNKGSPGSGSGWTMTIMGSTIDFNPTGQPGLLVFCAWFKAAFTWTVFIGYQWFIWTELRRVVFSVSLAAPAKGNTVAGSGGQITSFAVAVLITGVMVSLPAVYWTYVSGVTPEFDVVAANNPFTTAAGESLLTRGSYLLDMLFPVNLVLAVASGTFLIRTFSVPLVAGVHAEVRYFVV